MTYRTRNIAVAVGLALVAMMLTLVYITNYKRSVESGVATVKVYVAAHDVPTGVPGTELVKGNDIKLADVPRSSVVPGAISEPDQIGNLILSGPLYAGEQVTMRRFTEVSAEGVRSQIKGTMRAIQVAGDDNQLLAGTLTVGDHVDVVANIKLGSNQHASRIVLRNLEVLSIPADSITGTAASGGDKAIILAVSDTQTQRLLFVMHNADWTLQLRPVLDPSDSAEIVENTASILTRGIQ